jgi:hypothetical protein
MEFNSEKITPKSIYTISILKYYLNKRGDNNRRFITYLKLVLSRIKEKFLHNGFDIKNTKSIDINSVLEKKIIELMNILPSTQHRIQHGQNSMCNFNNAILVFINFFVAELSKYIKK